MKSIILHCKNINTNKLFDINIHNFEDTKRLFGVGSFILLMTRYVTKNIFSINKLNTKFKIIDLCVEL